MSWLNYHHLQYFWITAQELSVTRAARRLRLSQSTVSAQLLALEESLGHKLFLRDGGKLRLTEAGKIALDYANSIFGTGKEMLDFFHNRPIDRPKQAIRIGAISSLSKNLQIEFVAPVMTAPDVRLVVTEGPMLELVRQLQNHSLDLVLSSSSARVEEGAEVFNHPLGELPAYLVGSSREFRRSLPLGEAIQSAQLIIPSRQSRLRLDFDSLLDSQSLTAEIKAEVDDMALIRLFALSGQGLALVPEIVVQKELKEGILRKVTRIPSITEKFYAITASRRFPNPWVARMVKEFSRKLEKT